MLVLIDPIVNTGGYWCVAISALTMVQGPLMMITLAVLSLGRKDKSGGQSEI